MWEERQAKQHRRFNLELPLRVRFREEDREETGKEPAAEMPEEEQTMTATISSESCFFYVVKKPAVGARATMRVEIPMRPWGRVGRVLCQGNVVWVSDREVQGKTGVACTIDSYRFEPPGK